MTRYVVKQSEIDAMEGVQKKHFLNPQAQRVNKSLGDLTGLTGLGFHIIEVPPGKHSTEYHVHYHEDECVYVLDGEGIVEIGDETIRVSAGDFIGYRAGGLAHCMTNTGSTPLKCIVAGERREHDVGDYPRLQKRLFRNRGQQWNLVDLEHISVPGSSAGRKT